MLIHRSNSTVTIHFLSGRDPIVTTRVRALSVMADALGYHVDTLRANRANGSLWVSHWSYHDAGSLVGRIV